MRFSVWPSPQRPWNDIVDVVEACDGAGWDGVYFSDHFMPDDPGGHAVDGPTLECFAVVAGLAARTEHLRIGTLVCGNLYRHPGVVANAAATIDQMCDGRFLLGLGAGWQINEHEAFGIDLLDVPTRLDRFEEAAEIIHSMLSQPRTTVHGLHYRITDAPCDPKPVHGTLPLLIGGRGLKRTARIAARYADEWNAWCTPSTFKESVDALDRHCADLGRDPATLRRSTQAMMYLSTDETWLSRFRDQEPGRPRLVGTPAEVVEQVEAYRAVGVDELIIPDWTMGSAKRALDTLALFWNEVAVHFR